RTKAPEGLSSCSRLPRRWLAHHPSRGNDLPDSWITRLGRAVYRLGGAHWLPARAGACLGFRRYATGNSADSVASLEFREWPPTSPAQYRIAYRIWRSDLGDRRFFDSSPCRRVENGEIDRGFALREF